MSSSAIANIRATGEFLDERVLARHVAAVRVVLTLANVAVIWLDRTVPTAGTPTAFADALAAAALFILYAVALYVFLRRPSVRAGRIVVLSPLLDVVFAMLLILATDGYLSPFNLWLVFAVVGAGFSPYRLLPLLTALVALAANVLIACVPQERPLDIAVFTVRAGYLFAVATLVSSMCSYLTRQSLAVATIDRIARLMSGAVRRNQVARMLAHEVHRGFRLTGVAVSLDDGTEARSGAVPCNGVEPDWTTSLSFDGENTGVLRGYGRMRLTQSEHTAIRIVGERAASALFRIELAERLALAAAERERIRVADELHDTALQTLAALDLKLETLRGRGQGRREDVADAIAELKGLTRAASGQIRAMVSLSSEHVDLGPATVAETVQDRWPHGSKVAIAPDIELSSDRWRVVDALVKEGLNNARSHGKASKVRLRIDRGAARKILCSLENDGVALSMPVRYGYGLTRISNLACSVGGSLRLEPMEPKGTRLWIEFDGEE